MDRRAFRFIVLCVVIIVGYVALRPYINQHLYSATAPRPVEARGNLSDYERSTIEIFDRVSPSVVQIVGRGAGNDLEQNGEEGAEEQGQTKVQSGTGIIWDGGGDIVTNNHV